MEAEMPVDRGRDKEAVGQMQDATLLSSEREYIWVSADEADEPRTYYIELSKSERER